MLDNTNYNKVKVLGGLSELAWFLDRHAIPDLGSVDQPLTKELYKDLARDLEKHIEKLRLAIEGLSREGKFR